MSQLNSILPASNYNSPYYLNLPPPNCEPSEELARRFTVYKHFLRQLIHYLKEVSIIKDYTSKINYQLYNTIQFPSIVSSTSEFSLLTSVTTQSSLSSLSQLSPNSTNQKLKNDLKIPPNFFKEKGNNSIMDIAPTLTNYHKNLYINEQQTCTKLLNDIIPNLEVLKKNLSSKVKELKNLKGDFHHNVNKEISTTGKILTMYIQSIENFVNEKPMKKFKLNNDEDYEVKYWDPFLLKIQLDLQLKNQLLKENYLKAAFMNLQTSALNLEKIVYGDLQKTLSSLMSLINSEQNSLLLNLEPVINQNPLNEWEYFIAKNSNFIKSYTIRSIKDIVYPYQDSILTKCIRKGYLFKKNKYLKNYSKNYFVLSANFLHEFKSTNLSNEPISSIYLNEYKFEKNLTKKKFYFFKNSSTDDEKKIVFKSDSEFQDWVMDLTDLLSLDHLDRFKFLENKYNSANSGTASANKSEMRLNLDGLNQMTLNGIHTPLIQTPSLEHSNMNQQDQLINKLNDLNEINLKRTPSESPNSLKSPNTRNDNPFERTFNNLNNELSMNSAETVTLNNSIESSIDSSIDSASLNRSENDASAKPARSLTTNPNISNTALNLPDLSNLSIKPINPSPQLPSTPASTSATNNSILESNLKHQEYLKKQKNFLKQQQDLIDLKLVQSENNIKNQLPNKATANAAKHKSMTSITKMNPLGRVNSNFQISNSKFINLDNFKKKEKDKDQGKDKDKEKEKDKLPKFSISSDH